MNNIRRDCWSSYKEITLDSFHINNIVCTLDVLEVRNAIETRGFLKTWKLLIIIYNILGLREGSLSQDRHGFISPCLVLNLSFSQVWGRSQITSCFRGEGGFRKCRFLRDVICERPLLYKFSLFWRI